METEAADDVATLALAEGLVTRLREQVKAGAGSRRRALHAALTDVKAAVRSLKPLIPAGVRAASYRDQGGRPPSKLLAGDPIP